MEEGAVANPNILVSRQMLTARQFFMFAWRGLRGSLRATRLAAIWPWE